MEEFKEKVRKLIGDRKGIVTGACLGLIKIRIIGSYGKTVEVSLDEKDLDLSEDDLKRRVIRPMLDRLERQEELAWHLEKSWA